MNIKFLVQKVTKKTESFILNIERFMEDINEKENQELN